MSDSPDDTHTLVTIARFRLGWSNILLSFLGYELEVTSTTDTGITYHERTEPIVPLGTSVTLDMVKGAEP